MAATAEIFGYTEIDTDRLGVPYMRKTVRFGRKSRDDLLVSAAMQILFYDSA
jgi:hypothetical protein